jgi:putative ABC transport system permease protein
MLDDLMRDLAYGARLLRRAPGFAVGAITILALGAGVTLAMVHMVNAVSFHRLAIPDADRLVRLTRQSPDDPKPIASTFPFSAAAFYREHARVFAAIVAENRGTRVSIDSDAEPALAVFVSDNYFSALRVSPAHGRVLEALDSMPGAPPAVVLGNRYWQRHFAGDPSVVGRTLRVNGKPVLVAGVLRDDFDGLAPPGPVMAVWFPIAARSYLIEHSAPLTEGTTADTAIYGKLQGDVTRPAAAEQIRSLTQELRRTYPRSLEPNESVGVEPLFADARFEADVAILIALFALVFLSACANLGNLILARGLSRHSEIRTRLALGASRGRVVRQLLSESVVLAVLGSVAASVAGYWAARWLVIAWEVPPGLHVEVDSRMLIASGATVVLGVLGFGLPAALRTVRHAPSTRARQILVASQVAIGCVLLILAALLTRAADRGHTPAFAFDVDRIIVVDPQFSVRTLTTAEARRALDDMTSRIVRLAGVDGTSVAVPAARVQPRGRPPVFRQSVSPSYFAAVRLPLLRGRLFDAGERRAVVVSESIARTVWPGEDALGKSWPINRSESAEVIGVVRDSGVAALRDRARGEVYLPFTDDDLERAQIIVHTAAPVAAQLEALRTTAASSGITPTASPLHASLAEPEQMVGRVIAMLGSLATMLAFIGIFGLVAFSVVQRRREIGVRVALGARAVHIVHSLGAQYVTALAGGVIAGVALASAGSQVLRSELSGLAALDPISFASGVGIVTVAVLIAIVVPARRALRIDPASVLRSE